MMISGTYILPERIERAYKYHNASSCGGGGREAAGRSSYMFNYPNTPRQPEVSTYGM